MLTCLHYNLSPSLVGHCQQVKSTERADFCLGIKQSATDCAIKTLQHGLAANVSVKLIGCLTYPIVL